MRIAHPYVQSVVPLPLRPCLTLRGERPDRESVQAWLETATEPNVPTSNFRGRALYFAERMIGVPFRPNGSAR